MREPGPQRSETEYDAMYWQDNRCYSGFHCKNFHVGAPCEANLVCWDNWGDRVTDY